jgi:hypothetical protein
MALSGRRIAICSLLLCLVAGWVVASRMPVAKRNVELLPDPAPAPRSIVDLDIAAHAARNDVPALRAALAMLCTRRPGSVLLAAEPIDHFDWRTDAHPRMPMLPGCPGIEIVPGARIEAAYDRAKPGPLFPVPPTNHTAGWIELQAEFPRAYSTAWASLPVYGADGRTATVALETGGPCAHCGFGWEIDVALRDGQWVVVAQRNTSVS